MFTKYCSLSIRKIFARNFCSPISDLDKSLVPKLNIKSNKNGVLDNWLLNNENFQLLNDDVSTSDRDFYRQQPKTNIFRKWNDIAYYKDDILKYYNGYPRDPNFDRFLPLEIDAMLKEENDFYILDIRENQELEISKIDHKNVLYVSINNFFDHGLLYSFSCHKKIEALLPDKIKSRYSKFVVLSANGEYAELVTALIYAHGQDNASSMLGGIEGQTLTVDKTLEKYNQLSKKTEMVERLEKINKEQNINIDEYDKNSSQNSHNNFDSQISDVISNIYKK